MQPRTNFIPTAISFIIPSTWINRASMRSSSALMRNRSSSSSFSTGPSSSPSPASSSTAVTSLRAFLDRTTMVPVASSSESSMGATAFAADFEVPAVLVVEGALAATLALRAERYLRPVTKIRRESTYQPSCQSVCTQTWHPCTRCSSDQGCRST